MNSETIERFYGARCPDHDDNCCVCVVWTMYDRIKQLEEENAALKAISSDDSELLTIAWMDGSHRSTKAHRDTIVALQAEVERLREALEKIATPVTLEGFTDWQRMNSAAEYIQFSIKLARDALEEPTDEQ